MTHKGTVFLETERLVLRQFTIDDLEQIYHNCWSDFKIWKWTCYKLMNSIEDVIHSARMFTEEWLGAYSRPNRYSWAICIKDTNEVVGRLFGTNMDDYTSQIELTYELGQKWWNHGFMTEAVKAIIPFFFQEVGYNRIYCYHASDNPASGKVMKKCGMTYEGTMRHACRCNCGLFDKVNYAILKDDLIINKGLNS